MNLLEEVEASFLKSMPNQIKCQIINNKTSLYLRYFNKVFEKISDVFHPPKSVFFEKQLEKFNSKNIV